MRDELLAIEQFDTRLEAQVLVDGRTEYNTYRPHSALGMLTPPSSRAGSGGESCSSVESCDHRLFQPR